MRIVERGTKYCSGCYRAVGGSLPSYGGIRKGTLTRISILADIYSLSVGSSKYTRWSLQALMAYGGWMTIPFCHISWGVLNTAQ